MKNCLSIMGILIDNRTKCVPQVQDILTKHGDIIFNRIGSHDPGEKQHGLITLNLQGSMEDVEKLEHELAEVDGVTVRSIEMKH